MSMFCMLPIEIRILFAMTIGAVSCAWGDDYPTALPGTWNSWRGPSRDGTVEIDSAPWPDSLDESRLTPAWRVELGPSYSGPIIAPDRIFTTETAEERDEVVRAFDRQTGRQLWMTSWPGAMKVPFFADRNGSWIRSTPAYDGETLYVGGMLDNLVAIHAATGEIRWRMDFPASTGSPAPDFGFASSPMVVGDALYAQAGGAFYKLNKTDGRVLWKTLEDGGGMYNGAFSSPIQAEISGRPQILVQTRNELCGVDPDSGQVLWRQHIESFRGMNILTPTIWQDQILTSNYRGKTYLFGPKLSEQGNFDVELMWKEKAQAYMSSPVVVGDHAYLHLQNRLVCCIDLKTGQEAWRDDERFGDYWSIVRNGDRLLALDQMGELLLIRATPEKLDIRSRRQISQQETWAHLAVAGTHVAIRELRALAVYNWN